METDKIQLLGFSSFALGNFGARQMYTIFSTQENSMYNRINIKLYLKKYNIFICRQTNNNTE